MAMQRIPATDGQVDGFDARLRSAIHRRRLQRALLRVAIDVVGSNISEDLTEGDRKRLHELVRGSVAAASHVAIDELSVDLGYLLSQSRADFASQGTEQRRRAELGLD